MARKIRPLLLLFTLCLPLLLNAQERRDTIAEVLVSQTIEFDPNDGALQLNQMEYPFFDTSAQQLYFYFELSSIPATPEGKAPPFLYVEIKKRSNFQFRFKPEFARRIELTQLLEGRMLDSIDLISAALPSGNFDLIITLLSDSSQVLHQKKAGFQLLRPKGAVVKQSEETDATENRSGLTDFEKTFAGRYSLETLKKNIPALAPLAQGGELRVIRNIASNDKLAELRQFFYNFWYNRNPSDPEGEWKRYTEKLNYVAKQYGTASTPGYESDRGRVYLMFGEPDIHERVLNEKGALPYEIWFYYNTPGRTNVKFLFCQTGLIKSQMILLHSSEPDIFANNGWKQVLLEDPANNDTKLMHRVFEYFK